MATWKNEKYWSYHGKHTPRSEQKRIIDEIQEAMDMGFKNIILEAGTGIGKSGIATTIAKMVDKSYIVTMTNQLQGQYLDDFKSMLTEIKGRSNYPCKLDYILPLDNGKKRTCNECLCEEDEAANNLVIKYQIINAQSTFEIYDNIPEGFHENIIADLKLKKCFNCPYLTALRKAQRKPCVISNYDYLFYAGNYAKLFQPRDLLILDETHNFEKKVMDLVSETLNRKTILKKYGYDIFWGITEGKTLKEVKSSDYWIKVCNVLLNYANDKLEKQLMKVSDKKYSTMETSQSNDSEINSKEIKSLTKQIDKYCKLIECLSNEKWIIELPTKKEILDDPYSKKGLKAEFKPLTIKDYSESLLQFGNIRLFLTGTLGNKDKFCKWVGIDPLETYYIYEKSPFPVEHRPIIKAYVKSMSGFNQNHVPNWKDNRVLDKIREIISKHSFEKGVIHTSSNQQAWWIKKSLDSKLVWVAQGSTREETIRNFESSDKPIILVGAGLKDGVDFKGDKCRYQILFKMPFPSLASTQVNIRKHYDKVWYAYQTIMPLMQAYGRGIRDMDDHCIMYILDSDFDRLIKEYNYLFNEYFLEAIKRMVKPRPVPRPIRVNGGK